MTGPHVLDSGWTTADLLRITRTPQKATDCGVPEQNLGVPYISVCEHVCVVCVHLCVNLRVGSYVLVCVCVCVYVCVCAVLCE